MARDEDSIVEGEAESNTEPCINISQNVVRFEIDGTKYRLKPGDEVTLNKAYTRPSKMQIGRDPVPSQVELLTQKQVLPMSHPRMPKSFRARHEERREREAREAAEDLAQAQGEQNMEHAS